jgi:hypothetical protein
MTTTSIRSTVPPAVKRQGNRHQDELDTREAGQGVLKGMAYGGPLGSLIGVVVLTLAIPSLGSGAVLAGIIIGMGAGIVLGAFGGLYTRVRAQEAADSGPAQPHTTVRSLQHGSAD